MVTGSGPENTDLIFGSEGCYQVNEVPVDRLKRKDIQKRPDGVPSQGEIWLADLTGRVLSFLKGKPSDMQ